MTCLTCMSILCGGVRAVFAVGAETLLRRPLGLRPFPFELTVFVFVCLFLGSMLEVISGVGFFAFFVCYLVYSSGKELRLTSLFTSMQTGDSCEFRQLLLLLCENRRWSSSAIVLTSTAKSS
jgi:hypothetical protein